MSPGFCSATRPSSACATRSSTCSFQCPAIAWNPIGSPCASYPDGTLMPGSPTKLASEANLRRLSKTHQKHHSHAPHDLRGLLDVALAVGEGMGAILGGCDGGGRGHEDVDLAEDGLELVEGEALHLGARR